MPTKKSAKYYIYILRCGDGSLYTGWTNNLEKRVAQHRVGKGAKYTRSRLPIELVHSEKFASKQKALQREGEIKNLSRQQKIDVVTKRNINFNYKTFSNVLKKIRIRV